MVTGRLQLVPETLSPLIVQNPKHQSGAMDCFARPDIFGEKTI
jgi:hypothetical protein